MMRRYVQTERVIPRKKSVTRKSRSTNKMTVLSSDELSSIPSRFLPKDTSVTFIQKKSNRPKSLPLAKLQAILDKENDTTEHLNSRAAGSKQLNFKRQSRTPQYTLHDRLSRTNVVARSEDTCTYEGHDFHMTAYKCRDDIVEDVNLHLIDYDAEPEEIKYRYILHLTLESETDETNLLLSPAGRVCPICKTNEYIVSDLKNMPITYQDKNWRNRESFGEHCQVCGSESI